MPSRKSALLAALLLGSLSAWSYGETAGDSMPYPPLPEAISSFGAAASGNHLYVFGGHMGRLPGSSLDGLSPHFCRLDLTKPDGLWEDLPMRQSSQSPGTRGLERLRLSRGRAELRQSRGC